MNIYAYSGAKVVFLGEGGYNAELESAKLILKAGGIYTVRGVERHAYSSYVFLEEVPNKSFNTVMFLDVVDVGKLRGAGEKEGNMTAIEKARERRQAAIDVDSPDTYEALILREAVENYELAYATEHARVKARDRLLDGIDDEILEVVSKVQKSYFEERGNSNQFDYVHGQDESESNSYAKGKMQGYREAYEEIMKFKSKLDTLRKEGK